MARYYYCYKKWGYKLPSLSKIKQLFGTLTRMGNVDPTLTMFQIQGPMVLMVAIN